ncbi:VCBS repeat-containing protein [Gammaproteobacteria bacterium]|nr:VCBS repeat-containing protein [Gammaproteobacteria bacterium]
MHRQNRLIFIFILGFLFSCGGGGSSNSTNEVIAPLNINTSQFQSEIFSFDPIELTVSSSNYQNCSFNLVSDEIFWKESEENTFRFNAPITFRDLQTYTLTISSISDANCPAGQKNIELSVKKLSTKFDANPSNTNNLATDYYHIADIGFGGIEITERYSATICYPTPDDCVTYDQELFGQDAHNMATGDFNGDGFEDLVVIWAIFPHTIEEDQKIDAPIHIYLNDGNGHLYEDMSIYATGSFPTHPFAYRSVIKDFNSDGIDDIFAGSMGKQVRSEDYSENYTKPYPHLLLLSNSEGRFEDKSINIEDHNNGEGQKCGFAHDASGGDFDADGDFDIYACNILLVNDGLGQFSIHEYINVEWHQSYMSPMSSLVTDLNNDNFDDLLFWNFDNRFLFESQPEEGTILLSNGTDEISSWLKLDLPKGPHEINHNKYNHAAFGDINNDGFEDVVVTITRDEPYYEGAYIQILINDQTGFLVDETSSRFVEQVRADNHHGEGNIYLRDIDNDGDLDIFHSTRDFSNSISGAHIAINDGQGNFISNESILPSRPISNTGWSTTSGLMKGLPINLDKKGCLDIISTSDSWSNNNSTNNYLFSILNTDCSF